MAAGDGSCLRRAPDHVSELLLTRGIDWTEMRTCKSLYSWARYLAFVGTITAASTASVAQQAKVRGIPQTQAEMHAEVVALYDFHPSRLNDAERSKKSAEMDYFWNEMKADISKSLPLLRAELRGTPKGSFFLTDGSELLLSLSRAAEDKQLAADALAMTDLRDTQSKTYFMTIHDLTPGWYERYGCRAAYSGRSAISCIGAATCDGVRPGYGVDVCSALDER